MRLASIASGSAGNCILVESKNKKILVDVGISGKKADEGLKHFGRSMDDIDGILITHEHLDHIKGLGVFLRRCPKPVYATEATINEMIAAGQIGEINRNLFCPIEKNRRFSIGDIDILPIPVSHDAADPVCYRFDCEEKSCAVVTDLGTTDARIVGEMRGINAILAESNYETGVLLANKVYPVSILNRIRSDKGHLSNDASATFIGQILSDDLKHIFLGHISENNNLPQLAYEALRCELKLGHDNFSPEQFNIQVADRNMPSCAAEF